MFNFLHFFIIIIKKINNKSAYYKFKIQPIGDMIVAYNDVTSNSYMEIVLNNNLVCICLLKQNLLYTYISINDMAIFS